MIGFRVDLSDVFLILRRYQGCLVAILTSYIVFSPFNFAKTHGLSILEKCDMPVVKR